MKRTQTRRTVAGAAVLALIIAGLFSFLVATIHAEVDATDEASLADDRTKSALEHQKLALDLETGLRGYLITEDPDLLGPWHAGLAELPRVNAELNGLVASDAAARSMARHVQGDVRDYVEKFGKPLIAEVRKGGSTRAERRNYTVVGKRRADEIRIHYAELIGAERARADEAYGRAEVLANRALLWGALGLAGSVLLLVLFTSHQVCFVLMPIRRVGEAARELAAGDLATRVAVRGSGEVADLSRSFNSMAYSLEHTRDELENQNSELESQQAELERTFEELAGEKERLERLYRVGRAISGGTELDAVCATVLTELADLAGAEFGAVYVFTGSDGVAEPMAARGLDLAGLEPAEPNVGLAGRALAEGRRMTAAHGDTGLRVRVLAGEVDVSHELHIPLADAATVVGVLTLARVSGGPFASGDVEQLEYLAGRAAAGISRALTLRAAREQAALHSAVVETAADAFVTHDEDDIITAWNPAAERLFGWSAEEAIGRRLRDTIVPDRHLEMHDRITSLRAGDAFGIGGEPLEVEARHRDGHEFPIELIVSPIERGGRLTFNAFMRDISHRRNSERYMRAQLAVTRSLSESPSLEVARENVIAALADALGCVVGVGWVADNDAGVMRAASFWAAEGIDADAFRDASFATEFGRGEGLPGRAWETGEPVWIDDLRTEPGVVRRATAEAAGLRSAISFPVINDDQFIGMIEIYSTEPERPDPGMLALLATIGPQISQFSKRKRVEMETDRLKDQFFALVSHELRTPLTSIVGYLEMVLEDSDQLDPNTTRFLQVVERNSLRLQRLVGDLLFVAQVEAGRLSIERTEVPLARVVADSVEAARPRAHDSGVELDVRASDVGVSDGDPDRLGQMLDNLISNAVKFTPEGGRVTVELANRGGRAQINVRDTGVGIPANEQNRLFERFFRSSTATERAIPGVGLGLTISRAIVEAHGGTIDFTSEEGRGTTFMVDLPLASSWPQADPRNTPKEVVL
jgi:PAS domain S-box-containing protein